MQKFSEWLAEYGRGVLDDDLTAALREVTEAVTLEGRGGVVSLQLRLGQKGNGVIVSAEVKAKPPTTPRSIFFFARDGELSSRDPNQPPIPGTEPSHEEHRNV